MLSKSLLIAIFVAAAATTLAAQNVPQVKLTTTPAASIGATIDGQVVHVTAATAGAKIALFAVIREIREHFYARISYTEKLLDAAGDGTASYDYGKAMPPNSVWAVVDLETGAVTIATPPGGMRNEIAAPEGVVKNAIAAADLDEIAADRVLVRVLWVHPGNGSSAGAWIGMAGDGGGGDSDGQNNGHIHLQTDAFLPLGASGTAPKKFKTGDVVVAIDPFTMAFFSKEVAK